MSLECQPSDVAGFFSTLGPMLPLQPVINAAAINLQQHLIKTKLVYTMFYSSALGLYQNVFMVSL